MSIKTRKSWLAAGLTVLLAGGAPGFVAPSMMSSAFAQTQKITGTVVDEFGDPIIGANIRVVGTSTGAITDIDGKFTVEANAGKDLEVSFIGYSSQVVKAAQGMTVTLMEDVQKLDDVVVVGYGVQRKSDLTGAVASVKAEDLKGLSTTDAAASLQGKAAGVQIINGGAPGEGAQIRVRGYSSNSGNTGPLLIVDGVQMDNIQYLDPSMIQSMEVLKDAASAAIYGAQAGNGVVIITTKSGAQGTASISYSLKATMQTLGKKADLFNAADYIDYQTYIGNLSQETLNAGGYNGQATNWYDELFEGSWSLQHNITVQGGNEKGHFLANLGLVDNDGIVVGSKDTYKRLSAQINADYKFFKWFNVKSSTNIEKWSTKSVNKGYNSPLNALTTSDPLTPAYVYSLGDMGMGMKDMWLQNPDYVLKPANYSEDNQVWFGTSKYNDAGGNPLALLETNNAVNKGITVRGSLEANLNPIKELTISSRLGYRISQSNSHSSQTPWWLLAKNVHSETYSISASTNSGLYYQWENFANYMKEFGKHSVNAMVGMAFTKNHSDNTSVTSSSTEGPVLNGDGASNFNFINYLNDLGKRSLTVGNLPNDVTSLSYFGRLAYSYDNRYSVQANFRRDAFSSEKLSQSARWGNFPSFSAGWTISNEEFFKSIVNNDAVSFLKLRASWGRNGNVAPLYGYQYASTIGVGGYYQFVPGELTTGASPGKMSNPDLKWETSEQLDFGIDARFLSDRLTLGLDWFKKTTKDLLLEITGIPEIGGQSQWVNTGKVLNQGLDIELGWKDNAGDFTYSINTNLSPLKNEVKEVSSVYPRLEKEGVSGFNNKLKPTFEKGHKVWYFRGFKYAGVSNGSVQNTKGETIPEGAAMYYTADGKITNAPTEDDKQDLGSAIPSFTYGITLNLAYKGFDLTVFGTGAAGSKIYNMMVSADTPKINGIDTYWKNSWKQAGDNSKYPDMKRVATDWTFFSSDAAVFNGSYFKFKQIQLGYTLPKQLTKKALLNDVRFSVSLDDFFTITKYPGADPEVTTSGAEVWSRGFDNGTYPMAKKVVFGVNLTF